MARALAAPLPSRVLSKAFLRAGAHLDLAQKDLARIIGVSSATLSRLPSRSIDPTSKEGELALLFLRLYRSLDALLGGNAEACRRWLSSANAHLGGRPVDRIFTVTGLVDVVEYLDAMRGKV